MSGIIKSKLNILIAEKVDFLNISTKTLELEWVENENLEMSSFTQIIFRNLTFDNVKFTGSEFFDC